MVKNLNKPILALALLTIISGFLHFYNLNWGAPFYFHPDERNIASAVSQLKYPVQMNPHFFAYGSLPIYSIYFTGVFSNYLSQFVNPNSHLSIMTVLFEQAIVISRFYSAIFATLLVPILFFIGKKIKNETVGLITAFFTATSTGFIQFAHFGTFELWLTFFTVLLFWICLGLKKHATDVSLILLSFLCGILAAIKISHIAILPLAVLVITLQELYQNRTRHHVYKIARIIRGYILFGLLVLSVYCVTNPFVLLDPTSFLGSMRYESGVATGTMEVFYTGGFFHTIPILYQFLHVYPFLLNPVITIIFLPAFVYLTIKTIQTKNYSHALLLAFFVLLLVSQAFLFVKWIRYMIPTLPFVYLIIVLALIDLSRLRRKFLFEASITILLFVNILFGISYFITAFVRPDTRIAALQFANTTIPKDAPILSEVYDLGITPFNDKFIDITLFNFYDLDNGDQTIKEQLRQEIALADYIILPSQRVIQTRLTNKQDFPNGHDFYQELFTGSLGFKKIYQTPCDIFCQITYLGNPVYQFEQTASVFDRPMVYIFKRI